jgi:hypothetical protein
VVAAEKSNLEPTLQPGEWEGMSPDQKRIRTLGQLAGIVMAAPGIHETWQPHFGGMVEQTLKNPMPLSRRRSMAAPDTPQPGRRPTRPPGIRLDEGVEPGTGNLLPEGGIVLSKGDEGRLPIDQILADRGAVEESIRHNEIGQGTQSSGPLEIWKTEDGRYLLTDGYHRFADAVTRGDKDVPVRIRGEGWSDYWATPRPGNEWGGRPGGRLPPSKRGGTIGDLAAVEPRRARLPVEAHKQPGTWWRRLWGPEGPVGKTRQVEGEEGGREEELLHL